MKMKHLQNAIRPILHVTTEKHPPTKSFLTRGTAKTTCCTSCATIIVFFYYKYNIFSRTLAFVCGGGTGISLVNVANSYH